MAIVAEIRCDEIIARHSVIGQITRKLGVRTDMRYPVSTIWVIGASHVVEIDEWIVSDGVPVGVGEWDITSRNVFLICAPGNSRAIEQRYQMVRGCLVINRRIVIIQNAEICSRFEPKIVRQARMNAGRVVILLTMRCEG